MRSSGGALAVEVVALEPDSLGFHFFSANGVHHCIPLNSCGVVEGLRATLGLEGLYQCPGAAVTKCHRWGSEQQILLAQF